MELADETVGGIVVVVWYMVVCIGTAMCLKKSGRPAWRGFVPVLNAVELCHVAGLSGWFVLSVFVPIVNLFVPVYVAFETGRTFRSIGIRWNRSGIVRIWVIADSEPPKMAV